MYCLPKYLRIFFYSKSSCFCIEDACKNFPKSKICRDIKSCKDDGLKIAYDVAIFNVENPNYSGLEALKIFRECFSHTPIILLSKEEVKPLLWRALEYKISRYVELPCKSNDFYKALKDAFTENLPEDEYFSISPKIKYNFFKKELVGENKTIKLSQKESLLLELFLKNHGKIVTFDEIYDFVWGFDPPNVEALKTLIKDLRKKIGKIYIKNKYGIGYIFDNQ